MTTYRYANKPTYTLPFPTPQFNPSPENKDFDKARARFLWMETIRLANKGWDIVLEVFTGIPNKHLTVCGPIEDRPERHFRNAFQAELYEQANIHTVGWIDVRSDEFRSI